MLDEKSRKWITSNLHLFTPEIKERAKRRLSICQECPELRPKVNMCKKCGCIMPGKVFFTKASCPIGKWEAEN
jgi:hypothetical protein